MDRASYIKEHLTSREVLEHFGVKVGRGGMARCPFHGDKDESLKVYDDPRRGWHCFGCGAGSSVIDLGMMFWNCDFADAIDNLNEEFNLGLPGRRPINEDEFKRLAEQARAAAKRREAEEAVVKQAESAYWQAYDEWLDNDRVLEANRPKGRNSPSEAYLEAVCKQPELRDALDVAEEEWRDARERRWTEHA